MKSVINAEIGPEKELFENHTVYVTVDLVLLLLFLFPRVYSLWQNGGFPLSKEKQHKIIYLFNWIQTEHTSCSLFQTQNIRSYLISLLWKLQLPRNNHCWEFINTKIQQGF